MRCPNCYNEITSSGLYCHVCKTAFPFARQSNTSAPRILPVENAIVAAKDAEIDRLTAELDEWRKWGIIEVSIRNPNVAEYVRHWEGRAEKAETELDRIRASEEGALMILTQTIAERDAARAELAKLRADRQPAKDGEER